MKTSGITATLPAQDLGRAKAFYIEKVGLQALLGHPMEARGRGSRTPKVTWSASYVRLIDKDGSEVEWQHVLVGPSAPGLPEADWGSQFGSML